jgi:hypothetical protein
VAKPSKHIESGTTGVTRKSAPRQPVKKIANTEDLTTHVDDDELEDVEDLDQADDAQGADAEKDTDAAAAGGTTARKRKTPGAKDAKADAKADAKDAKKDAASSGKGGVRKVDRRVGRADAKAASKHTSKRVTAKGTPAASARYTPPAARYEDMPSPMWVPVLMFILFGLGMVTIFLNYVALLPGATSNWYLLAGLGFILAGIITATQYR